MRFYYVFNHKTKFIQLVSCYKLQNGFRDVQYQFSQFIYRLLMLLFDLIESICHY